MAEGESLVSFREPEPTNVPIPDLPWVVALCDSSMRYALARSMPSLFLALCSVDWNPVIRHACLWWSAYSYANYVEATRPVKMFYRKDAP